LTALVGHVGLAEEQQTERFQAREVRKPPVGDRVLLEVQRRESAEARQRLQALVGDARVLKRQIFEFAKSREPGHAGVGHEGMPQVETAELGKVFQLGQAGIVDVALAKRQYRLRERVAYSVYDPKIGTWSGLNLMEMPRRNHQGELLLEPGTSCCQWCELPDGDILLPLRYRRPGDKHIHTSTVALCGFDGKTLRYRKHGTELNLLHKRGLGEPSIAHFKGHFFLTLRNDDGGWVTHGTDGIHFEPIREWKFDDGKPLGSYNTQQHWVAHSDGLLLVYTRRGANNDHIMRHRAPLFIAQVDPERLCVIRRTERVLIPEDGACLGNFGVTEVSPSETWVTVGESLPRRSKRLKEGSRPRVIIARIRWSKPNRAVLPATSNDPQEGIQAL